MTALTTTLSGGRSMGGRVLRGRVFAALAFACTLTGVVSLGILLVNVLGEGAGTLSLDFLRSLPSQRAADAGFNPAIIGSLWVMAMTALICVPVGMGAAIYLELYARQNWLTRLIQLNIANLAGVPSIIYGILGLALFVRQMDFGRTVLAGSLTMALLVLPIVVIASQEALRAVPTSLRDGALALGATRWQTIRGQILPVAMPGMMTGVILALSRAMGETAPLIMVGAFQFVPYTPGDVTELTNCVPDPRGNGCPLDSAFTVMPVQIYDWARRPQEAFHSAAAAGIIVLLGILLALNSVAIILRNRYQRNVQW